MMMTVFIMAAGGHLRAHARLARVSQRLVERVAVRDVQRALQRAAPGQNHHHKRRVVE